MGRLSVLSRTGSPVFNDKVINNISRSSLNSSEVMTVSGAVNKTGLLTLAMIAVVVVLMNVYPLENEQSFAVATSVASISGIVGFVLVLLMAFKTNLAKFIALPYAVCEGAFLWGFVSSIERAYPGVAFNALLATIALLVAITISYKTGLIKVNETFKSIFKVITVAVLVLVVLNLITMFVFKDLGNTLFGLNNMGSRAFISIGVSLLLIFWGGMSLVMDINMTEVSAQNGAPRDFEWYCAVSILITMVYMYVEIVRLLIQLYNSTND